MAVQRVVSSRFTGNPGGTGLYQFKIADRDTSITPLVAGETVTTNGTLQVETATVVGSIPAAVQQVETGTVVGTVTGSGNATVIVTAAGMPNSPKTIPVAVVNTDTASIVAGKIRTALAADTDVSGFFTVGGTGADWVTVPAEVQGDDVAGVLKNDNPIIDYLQDGTNRMISRPIQQTVKAELLPQAIEMIKRELSKVRGEI